jgi:hypothetical protein
LRQSQNCTPNDNLGPEAAPFGGLVASQAGYGPFTVKQFSSPRRFITSFQVVNTGGEVAFEGGPLTRDAIPERLGGRLHRPQCSGAFTRGSLMTGTGTVSTGSSD